MTRALLFSVLASLFACSRPPPEAPPAPPKVGVAKDVVATVNGVDLTRFELLLRVRTATQPGEATAATRQSLLDAMVTDELFAQKAQALGLESDPAFQEEMARVQAQLAEVRRRELAKVLLHREVIDKAFVTEADAKAHFDAYPKRFGNEVRVGQIVTKGKGPIEEAQAALAKGRTFDEVAHEKLGTVPPGQRPWQLGPLRWDEVPASWWPALDALEVGQVSAPFLTVNDRWVILQLLERKPVAPDFERLKPLLLAQLKADRIDARRQALAAELRNQAKVELRAPLEPSPADPRP